MDRSNFCGCKGIRTCIKCEKEYGYENKNIISLTENTTSYVYCPYCNLAWEGNDKDNYKTHPNHEGKSFNINGIFIKENFITKEESSILIKQLDKIKWDLSQSGRRKQNFGPKCNFKKQKIKIDNFNGFPLCTKFIQEKFKNIELINNFKTVEQCSLEYNNINGSSIEPHIDDCWIWGERIITVNVIGDSVLTLNYYNGDKNKYNLNCNSYEYSKKYDEDNIPKDIIIRIPMPENSLIILYNEARYEWLHCIPRCDIIGRRVCIAYREFTKPYLNNILTQEILDKAKYFFDTEKDSTDDVIK